MILYMYKLDGKTLTVITPIVVIATRTPDGEDHRDEANGTAIQAILSYLILSYPCHNVWWLC